MTFRTSAGIKQAKLETYAAAVNAGSGAGKLRIYTGGQPATVATAASGTLLAEFTLNDPAFDAASSSSMALDVSPAISATASATGTAGWGRFLDSDDNACFDGLVGAEITLSNTSITSGQTVNLTGATINASA